MPWTTDNPPSVAKNWTDDEKGKCVAAANAVLSDGDDDEAAIFACINAAGKSKKFASKAVSLDEQGRRVRDAWYASFQPTREVAQPTTDGHWVKEVFEDSIILEGSEGLFSYPYIITDDGVEFGEPVKVEIEYKPVKESKAIDFDTALIAFGGEVKSLDDGRIGGYLVRFSDADNPDLTGDFFTNDTDFGFAESLTSPVYLNHTLPLSTRDGKSVVVKEAIGKVTLTIDDVGVLTDAVLYNRELYQEMLESLGWSSGTAAYLVQRKSAGKAQHITRWPLGLDASLTPIPAEPKNVVVPFKSLTPEVTTEAAALEDDGKSSAEVAEEAIKALRAAIADAAIQIILEELDSMEA